MEAAAKADRFKNLLVEKLGDRVECVVLTGSRARGDARADSDIDVWIFLKEVSDGAIEDVGRIVAALGRYPEINPQCLTFDEARRAGFRKAFSVVQLRMDGIVLHGELKLPAPTREEIRQDAAELAVAALMSARHYISVCEPQEALLHKLDRFVLKPLVWAIRYDVLLSSGRYHKDAQRLCEAIADDDRRMLVQVHLDLRCGTFNGPCTPIIRTAASVAGQMIGDNL